jgi:UDP-glucose 4-epimerase
MLQIAMVDGRPELDLIKLVPHVTLALVRGDARQLSRRARLVDCVGIDDVVDALVRAAEADT